MNASAWIRSLLDSVALKVGYERVPSGKASTRLVDLKGASTIYLNSRDEAYLQRSNPRLTEIEESYCKLAGPTSQPLLWSASTARGIPLASFRGDNVYIWQSRRATEVTYALTTFFLELHDPLDLLDLFVEDGAYGCDAYQIDSRLVSRDLLDSAREIMFLAKQLGLTKESTPTILDIGAGYGRLAHRFLTAFPQASRYFCSDAIAESSFLCEFYVRARGLGGKADVLLLDQIDEIGVGQVDIAINIHSFSECSLDAIEWWLAFLVRKQVRFLFIVPNNVTPDKTRMLTNSGDDMSSLVERAGYELRCSEPKYSSQILQSHGLYPAYYFLFALK